MFVLLHGHVPCSAAAALLLRLHGAVEVALEPLEERALGARDGKVAVRTFLLEPGERQGVDAARELGPELVVQLLDAFFQLRLEEPQIVLTYA